MWKTLQGICEAPWFLMVRMWLTHCRDPEDIIILKPEIDNNDKRVDNNNKSIFNNPPNLGHVSRPTGASLSLFPGIPACERYQAVVGTAGLLTPVHNQQPFTINDTNRYVSALNIYSLDTLNSFYRRFNSTTGGFFINVGLKLSFSCAMKAQVSTCPQ